MRPSSIRIIASSIAWICISPPSATIHIETAKLELWKRNIYRLTVDWRDIAYFNYLPSFANPFASHGSILDENSFDTHLHNTDVRLDLFPGSRFVPYLAFGHNSQDGRGITSFVGLAE